jgi:hypothetical protein
MNEFELLQRLADKMDRLGLTSEASMVDNILKTVIALPKIDKWKEKRLDHLSELLKKKRKDPNALEDYRKKAKEILDEELKKRQSGPPEERLYMWVCNRFHSSCSICSKRSGRVRSLKQWGIEGLPGSHICQRKSCNCRIVLLPLVESNSNDSDMAVRLIGLREDNTAQNMQQGFSLEPFWHSTSTIS